MVSKEEFMEKILRMQEENKKKKEQERRNSEVSTRGYFVEKTRKNRAKWQRKYYN